MPVIDRHRYTVGWKVGDPTRKRLSEPPSGRPDKIRLYFLDPKEKHRSQILIQLALETPSLVALWVLLTLGAVLSPHNVQLAEGLPTPFRRLVLQEIAN
jgi:hypothetical protein